MNQYTWSATEYFHAIVDLHGKTVLITVNSKDRFSVDKIRPVLS